VHLPLVCTPTLVLIQAPYMRALPTFSETHYMDKFTGKCCHTNACTLTHMIQATENSRPVGCTKQHSRKHSRKGHTGHGGQGREMHDRYCLTTIGVQQAPDLERWCPSYTWQPFPTFTGFVHLRCQPAQPRNTLVLSGQH